MIAFKNIGNIFRIAELKKKLLFTIGVLVIFRLGGYIPAIGVNIKALAAFMEKSTTLGGLMRYLSIFSGGALTKATIFALGISPYITASIMTQMLSMIVPQWEQMMKEGEYGRKVINQYTRYLTVGLSLMYSFTYAVLLESQGLVLTPGWGFRSLFMLSLTVGAVFVMWLGDQISLYGIGNGSSVLIFAGIVAQLPSHVIKTYGDWSLGKLAGWQALLILPIFLVIIGCIVYMEKGERKIPVQYARRVVGQKVYAGQSTYIPFKINMAGVMPVIFASAVLNIPMVLANVLSARFDIFKSVAEWFRHGELLFNVSEFLLIIFFSFFYTALIFNPDELAENIKKSGGFIPGIRPGKKTAEFFNFILTRVGLVGAIYLGLLALAPSILGIFIRMPFYLGGTSLLIMVGVALELASQIESYLIEHRYDGFLTSGRIKSRAAR